MNTKQPDPPAAGVAAWRTRLHQPWLVAAWPGMGAVGHLAQTYLAHRLRAAPIADLPAEEFFDLRSIEVERGLIVPAPEPKSTLLGWQDPAHQRDLVFFQADSQPEHGARRFCEQLVAVARELGAVRVCTFAAMATMIRPEATPRVFAVASSTSLLDEVRRQGAEPLADGSIGGLNGLLVAVAARRGMEGLCLLGEMPYFATTVANPKASAAVLRTFSRLAGIAIDLTELDAGAIAVERNLVEHLERAERAATALQNAPKTTSPEPPDETAKRARETAARIEALFAEARRDRSKAPQLKAELDRQGLFKQYEDRFLDLWKRAE